MTDTPTSTADTAPEVEVKNPAALLAKNRQLLSDMASIKAELKAAQDALDAAQSAEAAWRDRVYQSEVLAPLEADLRGAAAGPWQYLKDVCAEAGLLKMEASADGFERPVWHDETGEPADLERGLYGFLCDVHRRIGGDLGNCLRASGMSGGGATGSTGKFIPSAPAAPAPAPRASFGLR